MKVWDSDQLWLKAKAYAERANLVPHDNPDFPFWSALSLELLARSALTKIHPVLNADPRDDVSILYACGFAVPGQPKSIPIHSVFLRLEKTVTGFNKAQREVCDFLSLLRNQELHTAELAFSNLKETKWLPRYYEAGKILCGFLGKTLTDLFGAEIAKTAESLINALERETEIAVKAKIAAHEKDFLAKPETERQRLVSEAKIALIRPEPETKRVACPACGTQGLVAGQLLRELAPQYIDDRLYVDQEYLVTEFKCLACELSLKNVEEIVVAGIEPRFSECRETDLHELYEPELFMDYDNM